MHSHSKCILITLTLFYVMLYHDEPNIGIAVRHL